MTDESLVTLDTVGERATITLDSPHNRNALSRSLVTGLLESLDSVAASGARVVVLQAAGPVFCSGADLSEAATGSMTEGALAMVEMQRRIAALPQPVVCRLHGAVRAGGLGLVAASDVVIAAESVSFALTEVKLGLAPAVISLSLLPRLDPRAASELFLSGEKFDAARAAAIGLVTRAVPDADLDAEVDRVVAGIATGAAQGLRETKALLNARLLENIDAGAQEMADLSARLFGSEEAKEAMTAFLSRKK